MLNVALVWKEMLWGLVPEKRGRGGQREGEHMTLKTLWLEGTWAGKGVGEEERASQNQEFCE